ncbi:site-specific DNA-methyltransferase [Vibrio anguillarum]|uniref:site-specific DNA-methyltransferase n=1 Tax=Vibrio anguillarum TaxID=55601 RepID=UPI000B53BB83|nr:site-specific DNA-methyltransferase [Vibrio anguillarum]ASG06393.1 type III restriction endonuclease subunit M [Vibrio anguillarum]MBT3004884.1 site-specific DNA-methyltransferase [Vibrio anguillarum]MBT3020951.1 site-specific DNA-methyltransferase [Vibrio anguillarum]MBT9967326.1 site-specific DNA-methyltransferase [Vibrio anguillarum]MBT9981648.1 site-specific DNA-methyltransferase [Vibrio anguillarum]
MNIKEETVYSNVETANSKQLAILKKHFPNCFDRDGNFIQERMLEIVHDNEIELSKESYSLNWLGKSYSRLLANLPPKTLIREDVEHNAQDNHKNSKNLLIKGDNLEVLKHLVNAYSEKVKVIYIDPPYNTGSDGFVYNDDRKFTKEQLAELAGLDMDEAERILSFADQGSSSHSAWLTFIYPRLYVARELLKEDGIIFISIDDHEFSQLKIVCDEVFGEQNFVGNIVRATGQTTGQDSGGLGTSFDYILVYTKKSDVDLSGLPLTEYDLKRFQNKDDVGYYAYDQMRKTGSNDKREDRPNMFYPVMDPDGNEVFPIATAGYEGRWRFSQESYLKHVENNMVLWKKTKRNGQEVWWPYIKYYVEGRTKRPSPLWTDMEGNKKAARDLRSLFDGKKVFDFPKPIQVIQNLVHIAPNASKDDLILDFFAGSGTTAHAVMALNAIDNGERKFITIQIPEKINDTSEAYKSGYKTIFELTKDRLIKASNKIQEEYPDFYGDLGFKIFEIADDFRVEDDDKELTLSNLTMFDDVLLTDEQYQTLLTTWVLYDGSELTTPIYDIDLDGYRAHLCDRRLYMIAPDFSSKALKALLHKLDDTDDRDFDPNKIVYYANNFDSVKQMELNEALKSYANKKSIEIDVVVRN